jgi:TRAP transporter 4TM/12TM fusion protein
LPDYKATIRAYWHMIFPIFLLVYLLMTQHSAMFSAFWSLITTLVLAVTRSTTRMSIKELYVMILNAARSSLSVAVAMAVAGIIVGVLSITGLGLRVADNIIKLSGGNLFAVLLMVAGGSIILGMGLPTSACYVIAASISVSVLREIGVPLFQAHMFVLYYACLSTITPPVALSSYVAAGIANADPNKVGWTAFRLALAGFIIPFFFIYSPEMLLIAESPMDIITATASALLGVFLLAAGSEGYLFGNANWPARVLLLIGAITLIIPGLTTDLIGLGCAVIAFAIVRMTNKKAKTA